MKKLFTLVMTMLLGATLAFGQATGGSTDTKAPKTATGKKATKTKKGHKGGKKHKKGASDSTTTAPPK